MEINHIKKTVLFNIGRIFKYKDNVKFYLVILFNAKWYIMYS